MFGLIMDYCMNGSLYHLLHEVSTLQGKHVIEKLRIAYDIADGMGFYAW
jgi:hypothetical protein